MIKEKKKIDIHGIKHIKKPFASKTSGVRHAKKPSVSKTARIKHVKKPVDSKTNSVRIIPLGGLGEVGRNMMLIEYKRKILIVDVGFRMPGESTPGIDYIIPNTEYLEGRSKDIVGIVFTHGHYDHIGALPYVLKKIYRKDLKIYASPMTKGIIMKRQEDFKGQPKINVIEIEDGSKINLDPFQVEFFSQNHTIPGNMGLFIKTPVGNIVNTSDFKFDQYPVNDKPTDFEKLERLGKRGVLLLCCDSTGAEEDGHSLSERDIQKNLEKIIKETKGRIIISTFSSLLNRIQQVVDISEKCNRKICVEGFSMKANLDMARNLGYIKAKKDTFIEPKNIKKYPDNRITIICTGAQGESNAALMKIIIKKNRFIKLNKGDTVVFSSSVIPGNERTVQSVKDEVLRQGAKVYHYKMMDIHAGGHAKREELEKMIKIMNPKFFMPIHGQLSMLFANAELAEKVGIKKENIIVTENGHIVNLSKDKFFIEDKTVPSAFIMIDGLGVGDVGKIVLRDRHSLATDGMFVIIIAIDKKTGKIINSPDIISRGFVYLKESKDLLRETRRKAIQIVNQIVQSGGSVNWSYVKSEIRNKIGQFLFSKTKRRPMVLPVIIEV